MKNKRQNMILDIIQNQNIGTQEELASALAARGISVTQATVSRDIRELHLIKTSGEDGTYSYATTERQESEPVDRLTRMLSETVISAEASANLIVVKTMSGSASMAAEAIDSLGWAEVIGTLAGDNTFLVIVQNEIASQIVVDRLRELIH